MVEILLAKGANFEHRNVSDHTPLSLAASGGYVNIIKMLLRAGADINSRYIIYCEISLYTVEPLINSYLYTLPRTSDTGEKTSLERAHFEVTIFTFKRGQPYTLLRHATVAGWPLHFSLTLSLGRTGTKLGITPLMLAAMNGHTVTVKLLLDMGSDINAQVKKCPLFLSHSLWHW